MVQWADRGGSVGLGGLGGDRPAGGGRRAAEDPGSNPAPGGREGPQHEEARIGVAGGRAWAEGKGSGGRGVDPDPGGNNLEGSKWNQSPRNLPIHKMRQDDSDYILIYLRQNSSGYFLSFVMWVFFKKA